MIRRSLLRSESDPSRLPTPACGGRMSEQKGLSEAKAAAPLGGAQQRSVNSIEQGAVRVTRPAVKDRGTVSQGKGKQGPRDRLRQNGAHHLSDAEVLALVLRTRGRRRASLEWAQSMLDRAGDLEALADTPFSVLASLPGLGPATAASLLAAAELGDRLKRFRLRPGDRIGHPEDIREHFDQRLRGTRREHFMILLLDSRHRVMRESQVSQGTLTASLVHPREVFRLAVRSAAAAVVLVHNHPSGDPTPSSEDLEVTQRLVDAGELLGIRVVDHVVVAEAHYYSFRQAGKIRD